MDISVPFFFWSQRSIVGFVGESWTRHRAERPGAIPHVRQDTAHDYLVFGKAITPAKDADGEASGNDTRTLQAELIFGNGRHHLVKLLPSDDVIAS